MRRYLIFSSKLNFLGPTDEVCELEVVFEQDGTDEAPFGTGVLASLELSTGVVFFACRVEGARKVVRDEDDDDADEDDDSVCVRFDAAADDFDGEELSLSTAALLDDVDWRRFRFSAVATEFIAELSVLSTAALLDDVDSLLLRFDAERVVRIDTTESPPLLTLVPPPLPPLVRLDEGLDDIGDPQALEAMETSLRCLRREARGAGIESYKNACVKRPGNVTQQRHSNGQPTRGFVKAGFRLVVYSTCHKVRYAEQKLL